MHVTTVFSGRFQDLLFKMDDRAQHTAIWYQCCVCASHFYEYLHCGFKICCVTLGKLKWSSPQCFCMLSVFLLHLIKALLCYWLCCEYFQHCDQILKMHLPCFNAAPWALSAIVANPPPSFRCRDDYPMYSNWSNNQLSFCSLCLLLSLSALGSLLCLCQTEHVPTKRSSMTEFREKGGSQR